VWHRKLLFTQEIIFDIRNRPLTSARTEIITSSQSMPTGLCVT
jgi:hypothetical protein